MRLHLRRIPALSDRPCGTAKGGRMSLKFFEQYALCFLVWLGTAVGGAVLVVQGWQHIAALEHELNFANRKLAEERDLSTRQAAAMFDVGQRYDEVRGMEIGRA